MGNIDSNVFQVLVTESDSTLDAGGNMLTAGLSDGVLGVYNAETNESIAAGAVAGIRSVYFAIGRPNGKVDKGAGQNIQLKNVTNYALRNYTPSRPQIFELTGVEPECDTEYFVKMELRNSQISKRQGYNQFTENVAFRTPVCPSGGSVDKNTWSRLFREAVEALENDLLTVEYVTIEALTIVTEGVSADYAAGDVITDADYDTLVAYNEANPGAAKYVRPRVTVNEITRNSFSGSINTKYYYPTATKAIVSLTQGFDVNGTVTEIQTALNEEGSGYDIKQKEFKASNWNGTVGPYKVNTMTGLEKEGFVFHANTAETYAQIVVSSTFKSNAGWKEYDNPIETIIAIPSSNEALVTGLLALLDDLIAPQGFDELSDDYVAMNKDESVPEQSSELDEDTEGIA